MPESTIKPTKIQVKDITGNLVDEFLILDTVKEGKARIIARWGFSEQIIESDGYTCTMYTFEEKVLTWTPPPFYTANDETIIVDMMSRESVEAFIDFNSAEIMGSAKSAKVSW